MSLRGRGSYPQRTPGLTNKGKTHNRTGIDRDLDLIRIEVFNLKGSLRMPVYKGKSLTFWSSARRVVSSGAAHLLC
jgi:hypothetical protein